jgi:protein phosphatase 2C
LEDSELTLVLWLTHPDQKPDRKDERERLEARGAYVTQPPVLAKIMWPMTKFMDCARVNGALAMSRSIGDISLKKFITSEPEIKTYTTTSNDQYLIMATDGLWDVMSSNAAAKMAAKHPDAQSAADAILKYALDHRTQDNITVLVAELAAYK